MLWDVSPARFNSTGGGSGGSSVLTLGQLQAVSKLVPVYNSDSDALTGGLFRGDVYKAGPTHLSSKEGTEIIIP